MDGGIDDALALILALKSPELELVGVTAVSGNVPVEQAATNALRVLELIGRGDVWVAKGLANPLVRDPIRATSFHGRDGLGDSNLPSPRSQVHRRNALDLIPEQVASAKRHEITLIATGPLTNIAAVLTKDPDVGRKISELVIMGGAYGLTEYGYGNETPAAEFNIYSDPEAAKIVFESDIPIKAIGLDVTMNPETHLTMKDYARIKTGKTDVLVFARKILARVMSVWKGFALHDPMAVAAVVRPSLFKFVSSPVVVETKGEHTTGMTVVDRRSWLPENRRSGQGAMVCTGVSPTRFKRFFFGRLMAA